MAVPQFNIPDEALPDLVTISELDEKLFESLIDVIGSTEPTLTAGDFASRIEEKVRLPEKGHLKAVLGTAFVLYSLKEKVGLPAVDVAEAIVRSAAVANSKEFAHEEKRKELADRLQALLGLDKSLGVTSKAFDVMTEHQRTFVSARILSDIRPVFAEQPESASAAVIIHNLQIVFQQAGRGEQFYVAMDTDDIAKLKQVIERAEKKTAALRAMLDASKVPYLAV